MRRLGLMLELILLPAVWASDINGKWTAEVETPRGTSKVAFNFQVDGDKLTGTVTNRMGESEIQDGKIDGETVSFKQVMQFGREVTALYTGKISGDEIKFTRKFEGGPGGGPGGPGGGGPGGPGGSPRAQGGGGEGGPPPGGRSSGMGREMTFTAKRAK